MTEINLRIDGMHCGACVRRVTQALQHVPGTEVEEVRVGAARVKSNSSPDVLTAAVAKAGFSAYPEQ